MKTTKGTQASKAITKEKKSVKAMTGMEEFFVDELKDVYNAEKQILKALPKMAKAASTPELKEAFSDHLRTTEKHVERLERIFGTLGQRPQGKKCKGMTGLIEEGQDLMDKEDMDPDVLDAGLIGAAQRVEHYEIAAYGCLKSYAQTLGQDQAVRLLDQTLEEEEKADGLLTQIAEGVVNVEAARNGRR